jgi:hypothetical protein
MAFIVKASSPTAEIKSDLISSKCCQQVVQQASKICGFPP